jgi:hypothetical protein
MTHQQMIRLKVLNDAQQHYETMLYDNAGYYTDRKAINELCRCFLQEILLWQEEIMETADDRIEITE